MFSYAESIATRNTVLSSLREATGEMNKNRPAITFTINGESENPDHVYTTSDRIEGEVSITAPADIRFDEIVITFEGTTRTWMERFGGPGTSGRSTLSQTVSDPGGANPKQTAVEKIPFLTEAQFLRLVQPVDESTLPIPRIAVKGQKYTFPFTFVIPDRLLPSACDHRVENNSVQEAHLHLPPSLGEPGMLGKNCKDDLSPDMTRIGYAIRCRIMRRQESDTKNVVLADAIRKIAVSPVFETLPPLHIADKTKDFCLRREKDLRKGLLGRKLGRISVFAQQPQPLKIFLNSPCPPSTSVTIFLTWLSCDSSTPPPPLECLTAKLKTSTFFSTTRQTYIPTFSRSTPDHAVGNYTELNLLSSRCISNTSWEKQPSDFPTSRSVYTTKLLVPITAPKGKHLPPTFSSCFVSRSYTLELSVSVRTSSHTQPSLSLKLPLQVCQPGKAGDHFTDHDGQAPDVEEFFTPRSVAPPPAFERMQSGMLPGSIIGSQNRITLPGYSVFAREVPSPVGISPGCG